MEINSSSVIFSAPHVAQLTRRIVVSNPASIYAVWPGNDVPAVADCHYWQAREDRNSFLKVIAHNLRRETQQQLLNLIAFRI
jgi:hypothetical protein